MLYKTESLFLTDKNGSIPSAYPIFPTLEYFIPLSNPSHVLGVCENFNFGVVLLCAEKLLCAVCSRSCTAHTVLVKAGIDDGCEWAVDV